MMCQQFHSPRARILLLFCLLGFHMNPDYVVLADDSTEPKLKEGTSPSLKKKPDNSSTTLEQPVEVTSASANFLNHVTRSPSLKVSSHDVSKQNNKTSVGNEKSTKLPEKNATEEESGGSYPKTFMNLDSSAVMRAFYVLVGFSTIVIFYLVVRSVRLRRKKQKNAKYSLLGNQDQLETTPLGREESDEESVFEMSNYVQR